MTQIKNDDLTEVVSIIIKEILVQKEIVKDLDSKLERKEEKISYAVTTINELTKKNLELEIQKDGLRDRVKELEKELSETKALITPGNIVGALMKEASKKPRGPYKKRKKGGTENENTGA